MASRAYHPTTHEEALERRLETLELTIAEMVAIHRRLEVLLAEYLRSS
jgi:hypothetical protein